MAAAPFDFETFVKILDAWGKKYKITPPPAAIKMGKEKFLKMVFDEADENGDGKVSVAELKKVLED